MRTTAVAADVNVTPLIDVMLRSGFRLSGTPVVAVGDLESQLRDRLAVRSDGTVFFRVAGDVRYGDAVAAMDAAKGAGADRIGLIGGQPETVGAQR